MTEKEKITLFEETIEADEGTLNLETLLEDIDEYDSMSKLAVIVMMDDEFGVTVTAEMFKSFETVGDVIALMK